VPRNREGLPLVADQRNDVHLPISQLHVAFLHAHNGLVDRLREERNLYEAGDDPQVPVEFAAAAYRYGHSQIRERYRLNRDMAPTKLFPDLVGLRAVPPALEADWELLFDLPGRPPALQRARRIDGRLVTSLIRLPVEITGALTDGEFQSLAVRDLQRGLATGLPSGEAVARRLGHEPLDPEQIAVAGTGWEWGTPLWYYVLKEAEVRGGPQARARRRADRRRGARGRHRRGSELLPHRRAGVDADPAGHGRRVRPRRPARLRHGRPRRRRGLTGGPSLRARPAAGR
jgi:hypothetical protein